jgi:tetratricopeptide (TPR) repeat protein
MTSWPSWWKSACSCVTKGKVSLPSWSGRARYTRIVADKPDQPRRRARDARFHFSHRLTRDAAYAAHLSHNRRRLHSATADLLIEQRTPGMPGEAELLANLLHHLQAAGRSREAHGCCCSLAFYVYSDADVSKVEGLLAKAANLWQLARQRDPLLPVEPARWLRLCAGVDYRKGDTRAARARLGQAIEVAGAASDDETVIMALLRLANDYSTCGDFAEVDRLVQRASAIAAANPDRRLGMSCRALSGDVAMGNLALDDAARHYGRVLELANECGHNWYRSAALRMLGVVAYEAGQMELARDYLVEAVAASEELGMAGEEASNHALLARLLAELGQGNDARPHIEKARAKLEQLGAVAPTTEAMLDLATALLVAGDKVSCAELLQQSVQSVRASAAGLELARALVQAAGLYLKLGDAAAAHELSLAASQALGNLQLTPKLAQEIARLREALNSHAGASPAVGT